MSSNAKAKNDDGSGDHVDSDLDETIIENSNIEAKAAMENMRLQLEQLTRDLQLERTERQRLSDQLAAQLVTTVSTAQSTEQTTVSTAQSIVSTAQSIVSTTQSNALLASTPIGNAANVQFSDSSPLNPQCLPFNPYQSQASSSCNTFPTSIYTNTQIPSTSQTSFHQKNVSVPAQTGMNYNNTQFYAQPPAFSPPFQFHSSGRLLDLPRFSGVVEEWPAFTGNYRETTMRMGYANWENHARLLKALFGPAKEATTALMIHPDNVNEVMAELKEQFGTDEMLLRSQLEKAKKWPVIPEHRLDQIVQFATKVRNLAAFLESIDSMPHLANPTLIDELVNKLPPSKMMEWGTYAIHIKPYVTVCHFSDWIKSQSRVVSLLNIKVPQSQPARTSNKPKILHVKEATPRKELKCTLCKGNHLLVNCPKFEKLNVNDRWSNVKQSRLCFSCLRYGHETYACRSKKLCNVPECKHYHNPLLHDEAADDKPADDQSRKESMLLMNGPHDVNKSQEMEILFKILPVVLHGPKGETMESFALIDEGSSITMVDESVLRQLNIKGKPERLCLQWFGNKTSTEESEIVDLHISGSSPNSPKYHLKNVRSVKHIDLPVQTLSMSKLSSEYRTVKKLPINQYENAKPLVLIGLDHAILGAPSSSTPRNSSVNEPIAVKTKLGWLVYGPMESTKRQVNTSLHVRMSTSPQSDDERFEDVMENFFTAESFGVKVCSSVESDSDIKANELLQSTTLRIGERFQTGLLWKDTNITLPPSYEMAKRRLLSMEKKMSTDPQFNERYTEMVNAFIQKGYARKLSSSEAAVYTTKTWYLPHFATSNINKPGKYRLVFDAAARSKGVSLNDNLLKGPDLYNPLVSVLFNFRSKKVGVCGDIMEMFSQIKIQPSDVHAQRFLWRNGDASKPVDIYVMESMTFGVTCSPASAHHVKNVNAMSFVEKYPEAVNSIIYHHYVDDFVDSFENIADAKRISSEVSMIHSNAGFILRGFASNEPQVAEYLNGCEYSKSTKSQLKPMNLETSTTEKILGLIWDTDDDCFKFMLKFNKVKPDVIHGARRPTKRELLSIIMSVFDPFGFLSNIMIHPKVMMQELWRRQLSWDDPVPDDVNGNWLQWREALEKVKLFKLPRYYFSGTDSVVDVQLHTFVDASQDSFAAVTYLRINDGTKVTVRLVSAKTRCAPIKMLMSIPRLELQAAVMGTRICASIENSHKFQISQRVFWSDSATVVSWIKSDHRRYKPFVAHRISEIVEVTKPTEWRWIPTKLNVADNATRAKYPIDYDPEDDWVSGPPFLLLNEEQWPSKVPNVMPKDDPELSPKFVNIVTKTSPLIDVTRSSSYLKLKRILAWIRRFINIKCHLPHQSGELTAPELQKAEYTLCHMVQKEVYKEEFHDLTTKQRVAKSSSIYKLTPIVDSDGLIRLNGRIGKSDVIPTCTKRPVILPKDHPLTTLIVHHYHCVMKHQNRDVIIAEIRRLFWIPSLKSLVNKAKSQCQLCRNRLAQPSPPMMGELPLDRVTAYVRPFTYTGVDYFGPYEVAIGRRREKRWVALFTCLTVRAVHLELAADMSTDAFLLCVRNFVNRRGVPIRIRSDNGTNFVGATKEIDNAIDCLDHDRIRAELSSKNIEWLFNCPDNPHAGGSWERLVQAVKRVLSHTLHAEAPRVETFRSLLIEAENIVNSRPLTDTPLSHEEEEPLSPNHFLIGCSNSNQTPGPDDGKIWCMRKQWRISQQLKNRFWKKWVEDYLPTIIRRSKWIEKAKPLEVDDLVLVVDSTTARPNWSRGRIIEVFPGSDGQVRSARVKTASGILKRPAIKLAVLDVRDDGESTGALSGDPGRFTGGSVPTSPYKA